MVPLLIPLIILGTLSIALTQGYIKNNIEESNIKMLNQTKENIDLVFNEIDSLSLTFETNPFLVVKSKSLLRSCLYDYDYELTLETINNMISAPVNAKQYIQSLYIYYENDKHNLFASNQGLVSLNSILDKSWYDSFITNSGKENTWIESRSTRQFEFEKEMTSLITLYRDLTSSGSQHADGVIVMNIKKDYLDSLLKGLISYPDHSLVMLDEKSTVISEIKNSSGFNETDIKKMNSNSSSFFEFRSSKGSYMVSQIESERYHLKYLSIIPKSSFYKIPIQLVYITCLFVLISLILGLAITYYITKRNYNRIENIISAFESAENGAPLPELPSRIKDEYGFILQNIIKTFIQHSYLKVQLSEKKYRLKTAEILALQSQINPHFLFNTLKTIYWMSFGLTEDQNEVSKMIENLSGILHYSLGSSDKTVSLEEEIQNTQSYIEIQKIRYKDKFSVIWQYNENIIQNKVIKLLFQPFIENCIYHGIKEKEGMSCIKIKIYQDEVNIRISIIDNGLGMEHYQLLNIREKFNEENDNNDHIGILNTYKRLKLMYGDECNIIIRSKLHFGTSVFILIPISK